MSPAALTHVGGNLRVTSAPPLASVSALTALNSVGGTLVLSDLDSLVDLDGLSALQSVSAVVIAGNAKLTSVAALSQAALAETLSLRRDRARQRATDQLHVPRGHHVVHTVLVCGP